MLGMMLMLYSPNTVGVDCKVLNAYICGVSGTHMYRHDDV